MDTETKTAGANSTEQAAEPREWLTLRQAAAELQISLATLRRAYHRGDLVAYLVGSRLRIRRADLQEWLESQRWSPALCQERTARPRARRRPDTPTRPSASHSNPDAASAVR